ncbi:DNA methyltransferase [Sulfitobacter sp. 1A13421]|uniref:DNA methyltransferase n=1 Tax=Sulfitobacter sp. 1A13421 TaxID=3368595 RepID=UPI003747006B
MPTLRWLTRDEDVRAADKVPYRLLEEQSELGYGDPRAGNILIQGDNLDALKALQPYYAGQVKCIYIDPPYNTGSAFEHYDDNLEHSQWLSIMQPRLELLRDLLVALYLSRRLSFWGGKLCDLFRPSLRGAARSAERTFLPFVATAQFALRLRGPLE